MGLRLLFLIIIQDAELLLLNLTVIPCPFELDYGLESGFYHKPVNRKYVSVSVKVASWFS